MCTWKSRPLYNVKTTHAAGLEYTTLPPSGSLIRFCYEKDNFMTNLSKNTVSSTDTSIRDLQEHMDDYHVLIASWTQNPYPLPLFRSENNKKEWLLRRPGAGLSANATTVFNSALTKLRFPLQKGAPSRSHSHEPTRSLDWTT